MGRVFSISFSFKGAPCSALVSLKDEGYDLSLHVHYLNDEIGMILPGRKLVFSLANGFLEPSQLTNPLANELAKLTSEEISRFLERTENDISSSADLMGG